MVKNSSKGQRKREQGAEGTQIQKQILKREKHYIAKKWKKWIFGSISPFPFWYNIIIFKEKTMVSKISLLLIVLSLLFVTNTIHLDEEDYEQGPEYDKENLIRKRKAMEDRQDHGNENGDLEETNPDLETNVDGKEKNGNREETNGYLEEYGQNHEETGQKHENDKNHEENSLKHQKTEEHQIEPVTATIIGAAMISSSNIFTYILKQLNPFEVTCQYGYKRGNNIVIINNSKKNMYLISTYLDSGKLLTRGPHVLEPKEAGQYIFTKKSGSATGANGAVVFSIGESGQKLTVMFENPWSSWNFAYACIANQSSSANIWYNYLYDNKNTYSNCLLGDNTSSKRYYYYYRGSKTTHGYKLQTRMRYEYVDGCYIQEVAVLIE